MAAATRPNPFRMKAEGGAARGIDREEAARALRLLVDPAHGVQLQAFPSGWWEACPGDDVDGMLAAVGRLFRDGEAGAFFTLNPCPPGMKEAVTAGTILRRRWLLIDLDAKRKDRDRTNATDAEKRAAEDLSLRVKLHLEEQDWPPPVQIDSGNGAHLLYRIDLPNDDESRELVRLVLARLGEAFDTDAAEIDRRVFNANRVSKLPGTLVRKGPNEPEVVKEDGEVIPARPWRMARIVSAPDTLEVVTADQLRDLTQLIESPPEPEVAADRPAVTANPFGMRTPSSNGLTAMERAKLYIAKEPPAVSGQDGSGRCFHVACVLVKDFGLTVPEAFLAIQDWNTTCQPPWSEKELLHKLTSADRKPDDKPRGWRLGEGGWVVIGQRADGPEDPVIAPAEIAADDVATIDDLIRCGAEIRWLWKDWIQVGVLNVVAAEGGTGKTRFCADLLRRIRHGLPWPDGAPMQLAPESLALWVVADNHHDEMVTLSLSFRIKDGIRLNAHKSDPYGGVSLDTEEDLAALAGRIQAVKPALVVIDTVGNATDRNLSRQEDAKAFYQPLQVMARRANCAILCLTHLSANGGVLGRRAKEKVRSLIMMSKPDINDEKRRLWVEKTNSRKPLPLGVTMGDLGNDYDDCPPDVAASPRAAASSKVLLAAQWLSEQLTAGPKRVSHLRTAAEAKEISSTTLYRAKDELGIEEFEAEGKKWWRVASD